MATGSFYTKYGTTGPGDNAGLALVKGQEAVGNSFKDALKGVDDLLKKTEDIYRRDNTEQVNLYLRDQIKSAGLGADAPEMLDIKSQFGNLIDTDAIDKTITSTRGKMVNEAVDDATGFAGQTFKDTEDFAKSGEALKQRLLSRGMKEIEANKHVATWRQDNQFLAEDIKVRDTQILEDFKNSALATFSSHGGTASTGEVIKNMADAQLPKKLRSRGIMESRDLFDKVAALSEVDKAELTTAHQRIDQQGQAEIGEIELRVQQQKELVKQMGGVSLGLLETVRQKNAELGGLPNAIKQDVENNTSWYRRWFDNVMPGKDLDEELSQHLQSKVMDMVDNYGLDMDTAAAVSLQAYNDFGGVMPKDKNSLDTRMAGYLDQEIKRKDAMSNVMSLEAQGLTRKNQILDQGSQQKQELLSRAQVANMAGGGGSITKDFETNFKNKLFNPGQSETVKPGAEFKPVAPGAYSQMWSEIDKRYGLPDGWVAQVAAAEGGEAGVKNKMGSPATGFHQWMPETSAQYKVDPNDPQSSGDGIARYAVDAKKIIDPFLGREATPAELYLSVIVGPTGFTRLMANPDKLVSVTQAAGVAEQNGGKGLTGKEFAQLHMDRFNSGGTTGGKGTGNTPGITPDDVFKKAGQADSFSSHKKTTTSAVTPEANTGAQNLKAALTDKEQQWAAVDANRAAAKQERENSQSLFEWMRNGGFNKGSVNDRANKLKDELAKLSVEEANTKVKEIAGSDPDVAALVKRKLAAHRKA